MSKTRGFQQISPTLKVPVVQSMVADLTTSTNCGATFGKAGRVIRSSAGAVRNGIHMKNDGFARFSYSFNMACWGNIWTNHWLKWEKNGIWPYLTIRIWYWTGCLQKIGTIGMINNSYFPAGFRSPIFGIPLIDDHAPCTSICHVTWPGLSTSQVLVETRLYEAIWGNLSPQVLPSSSYHFFSRRMMVHGHGGTKNHQEPMVHRLVEVAGGDWSAFPPLILQVSCSSSLGQVLACLMVTPISEP